MTFFSLVVALLLEQMQPQFLKTRLMPSLRMELRALPGRFSSGWLSDARWIWCGVMLGALFLSMGIYIFLYRLHPLFAFLFNVCLLWVAMEFGQGGRFYTEIQLAIRMGELERARDLLSEWRGRDYRQNSKNEVARLSIEALFVCVHKGGLGLWLWFVILPGPYGVVMYWLARVLAEEWNKSGNDHPGQKKAGQFARWMFEVIDWLPARFTAFVFSIAGNFENALYCARTQAAFWPDKTAAWPVASGAGAIGVRLGLSVHEADRVVERPLMGAGSEADADSMQAAMQLVWRALLLCLLVLALLGIAG